MKRFVVSYSGRYCLEVNLKAIDPKERSVRGSTLFLRPKTTNVLTEKELEYIKAKATDIFRYLVVHREIKPKEAKLVEVKAVEKTEAKPKDKKSGIKPKKTTNG